MTEQEAFARIQALTHQLNEHNHRYYVLDEPSISDQDFDLLMQELQLLESAWPRFLSPQSPSQRVGGQVLSKFENAPHRFPMLSLGNTYSREELAAFDERVQKGLGKPALYVGELKFDGVAISLTYEKGKLVRAITRGDGQKGDVVTANVKTIRSIPLPRRGVYPAQRLRKAQRTAFDGGRRALCQSPQLRLRLAQIAKPCRGWSSQARLLFVLPQQ
jgi:DNA ligase (NAD+)